MFRLLLSCFLSSLYLIICCLSTPALVAASEGKCRSAAGAPRLCRLTPLGVWGGKLTYDPYETLGVSSTASLESIQKAYRLKARACHPDIVRASCAESSGVHTPEGAAAAASAAQGEDEEPFIIINAAYEMLRKEEERLSFDRNGSGDGGRFVKRGFNFSDSGKKPTSLYDIISLFTGDTFPSSSETAEEDEEGYNASYYSEIEEDDDDDDDEIPLDLFSEFDLFGTEKEHAEEEEGEGEEEEGETFPFDFSFADLGDLF